MDSKIGTSNLKGAYTNFRTYKSKRETNLKWQKSIPSHWTEVTLSQAIESLESGSRDNYEKKDGVVSLGGEHINKNGKIEIEEPRYVSRKHYEQMKKGFINQGDVLLVKDGATIGKTAYVNKDFPYENAAVNSHVYILRSREFCKERYLYYLIFSEFVQEQINLLITGSAQEGLSRKFTKFVDVPLPTKEEQEAIVKFLDRETSKIDRLIEKQEKLIDLLEEKRTTLISESTTKGLEDTRKMKDSGVDWLGQIPQEWETIKLRNIFKVENGSTPQSTEEEYWGEEIPWATPDDLNQTDNPVIDETKRSITQKGLFNCGASLVPKGSILLSTRAPIGHLAIAGTNITTNQGCKSLVFRKPEEAKKYFYYTIKGATDQLKSLGSGSTYDELNSRHLKSFRLPLPPSRERKEIENHLNFKTNEIDSTIDKITRAINKLKEYRTALISAAVTGKIDVRGEVE